MNKNLNSITLRRGYTGIISLRFFSKETFQVYPTLTNFTQRKRKTHYANDLLALSLVSIIVYVYLLDIVLCKTF